LFLASIKAVRNLVEWGPTVILRYADLRDYEAVVTIRSSVLEPDHPYHYEDNIGQGGCLNIVAIADGNVVGLISVLLHKFKPDGEAVWGRACPYVAFEGVLPNYRRRGIGRLLITAAIDQARRLCPNQPYLYLEHDPKNQQARRLYDRVGFEEMSEEAVIEVAGTRSKWPVMRYKLMS
jgi:ribosomal protein S18 acetylase RimI-like enzyme